ncbi:MAG: glycosyltransferase [Lachnospiraceae bacterium]|nr:glycosyltransferase [Lachnospiraceae bacterium]
MLRKVKAVLRRGKRIVKQAQVYTARKKECRAAVRARIQKVQEENKSVYYEARYRYISYYEELPLQDNLILAESQYGMEIASGMLQILKVLAAAPEYAAFELCLVCHGRKKEAIEKLLKKQGLTKVKTVVLSSDEYFKALATAKYLLNDKTISAWWIKREGQKYLNLCQSTPVEFLGRRMKESFADIGNMQKNYFAADYLFFPNTQAMECVLSDLMINNLAKGKCLLGTAPQNEVFADEDCGKRIRRELSLDGKRVYAYLPAFRGNTLKGKLGKNDTFLVYYLYRLDKQLSDGEVLFVKLHPAVQELVDFDELTHVHRLPEEYELYEFLCATDVLVTDYSDVLFDYPRTGKKQVLFTYDLDEFAKGKGLYTDVSHLPFPKVETPEQLLLELRSEKNYDDTVFLKEYCCGETSGAAKTLCDAFLKEDVSKVTVCGVPDNGKENVLLYLGALARNGLTQSAKNLLANVDLEKYNYIVAFASGRIRGNEAVLKELPEGVSYVGLTGSMPLTLPECYERIRFIEGQSGVKRYLKKNEKRVRQDWKRLFGGVRLDTVIQFNGYETEMILLFSMFEGNSVIFVHNDMVQEIKTRRIQRRDVLEYAYQNYKTVAVVTEDLIESTATFLRGKKDSIKVCRNVIDYEKVVAGAKKTEELSVAEEVYPSVAAMKKALGCEGRKLISIGRFSPEKGHFRLLSAFAKLREKEKDVVLFIAGGVARDRYFEKTVRQAEKLGLAGSVVLIRNMPNPYPLLAACDGFVLSSLYEGFGLVIAEADVLKKPVACTDIVGPRGFLKEHGGTLVEDSEDGIYRGMQKLLAGEIPVMQVDYVKYNEEAIQEFYSLL